MPRWIVGIAAWVALCGAGQSTEDAGPIFAIIAIIVVIGIFFAIRGVFMWYWKIDERIRIDLETQATLKEIKNEITEMSAKLGATPRKEEDE